MTENNTPCQETYISVDVETAGPLPRQYSLLSIGACTVAAPVATLYLELRPVNADYLPEALQVSGLSMAALGQAGLPPAEAMARFADWVAEVTPPGHEPVFVAFNAPFDWMFVNDYFHNHLGRNPFGHKALDVKAFYMGLTGSCWQATSMHAVAQRYLGGRTLSHHALQDALDQAEIFRLMLAEAKERAGTDVAPSATNMVAPSATNMVAPSATTED
ncbi:MAG: 3'-5' exonuclease [Chloroflexota bacterium]